MNAINGLAEVALVILFFSAVTVAVLKVSNRTEAQPSTPPKFVASRRFQAILNATKDNTDWDPSTQAGRVAQKCAGNPELEDECNRWLNSL